MFGILPSRQCSKGLRSRERGPTDSCSSVDPLDMSSLFDSSSTPIQLNGCSGTIERDNGKGDTVTGWEGPERRSNKSGAGDLIGQPMLSRNHLSFL